CAKGGGTAGTILYGPAFDFW
nr:immunoglobulin heavy chain junction region [Macaca mulatta]MOV53668.1 immunoglobulin heavy chain junction region [Macaca mulatta]MOV53942.1 immunoglobulin heavy chain junction region [Macaca mulatta]MOV54770.1 immunoglobulin heavy chain junction region [Macaca mulatta]MOV55747.1 immunoglobulin heavy chain junction region [Macaca mulatta]